MRTSASSTPARSWRITPGSGWIEGTPKPSEFVTRNTEFFLGLVNHHDKPKKSIQTVGAELRDKLDTTELNIPLENLREERKPWESGETRLEKALKMLPAINPERSRPSPDSLKQLKSEILKDAQDEAWLRIKVLSLECGDGFKLAALLPKD